MKQKRSDITPMDEDTPNTWKTVMSKSAKVAGDVAKQLVHGNDSDGVWSSDEDASGDEVEFVKQTRLFVRSTSSSSDDNDDSVQILGVKNAEKTNYYADLMAPTADYGTGEDEDEEDDDDDYGSDEEEDYETEDEGEGEVKQRRLRQRAAYKPGEGTAIGNALKQFKQTIHGDKSKGQMTIMNDVRNQIMRGKQWFA
mmetsp:Transcript_28232/g.51088  ORF Transcript_28232/g.51088 Transcript_28232/m.51088 type:complete len:197 (+) Transcript_28232:239-829(+)